MNFETLCVHAEKKREDATGAVSVPIYQTAMFAHKHLGESTGYDYSRLQNPTREHLENVVAGLEGGIDALAFSTGMAAVTALMELFSPGDHIISSNDLYGGSYRLFQNISKKNGLTFTFLDTSDTIDLKNAVTPATKAIFVETPTNPMMRVTDIAAVSEIAKKSGALLIVDNTFLTPYYQRPLDLGADVVLHSGTKYLCGHNDTLAGFLVVKTVELSEKLRFIYKTTGAGLAPFDSWLIIRGLKTLPLRLDRQNESARKIAEWLSVQPKVKKVYYVGLKNHPDYAVSKKQTTGFGGMISFEVDSAETVRHILGNIKLILFAESLGGVETLLTYPCTQTHADVPKEEREAGGITDRLLRLSVGVENADDLIADLSAVLS
ncbi:cystathionine gamma-synthase [Clostridia bacterium]|nr:cystathionine gamma-synthase [Clostridia bacterium]